MTTSSVRYRIGVTRRIVRGHGWGAFRGWQLRHEFAAVRRFVVFVGYSRSGHSVVAALLDAHRRAAIAHEEGAVLLAHARVSRRGIFGACAANTREVGHTLGHTGGRQGGYRYDVPGQWQGRWERLEVVGDKHGEDNARRLAADASLGARLERVVGVPVEWIHVVRNPFDNVATILRRSVLAGGLADTTAAVERYVSLSRAVERVLATFDPVRVHTIQHESFVSDPQAAIESLCLKLRLDVDAEYLEACRAVVFPEPRRTRHDVQWPVAARAMLETRIDEVGFLRGYRFDEGLLRSTT